VKNKGIRNNSSKSRKTDATSRVVEDSFFDIIRKSARMADVKINDLNQYYKEEYKEESWSEYEATYSAILYKELTESIDYKMITMENRAESQKNGVKRKKYDIWITKGDIYYILEVKRFGVSTKTDGLRGVNDKKGIYGDLMKLDTLIRTIGPRDTYGIAIGFFEGNDSITLDDIDSKLDDEIWGLLDKEPNLKLLICAGGKCKYVGE
jgi:hypothetical protein